MQKCTNPCLILPPRVRSPLMLFSIEKDPNKTSLKSKVRGKLKDETRGNPAQLPYPSSDPSPDNPSPLAWVSPRCEEKR